MNKKLRLAIPVAVLALTCGAAAVGCSSCNEEEEHVHSYTVWDYDETEHWKKCSADGAIDESTRGQHVFVAGECDDCGAVQQKEEVKYGSASGKIRLHKNGAYLTDFSGVTVDIDDDGADVEYNSETGTFTIENLRAGVNHNLTVSKTGYNPATVVVNVEENEEATVGGVNGITLEYRVFKEMLGWGSFDWSKQNEAVPEIGMTNDCALVFTNDTFESDVMASIYLSGSNYAAGNEGLVVRFYGEDIDDKGEAVTVRMEGLQKIQFASYNNNGKHFWQDGVVSVSNFKDLIFFTGTEADAKSAEYLQAYADGQLKLSVVREGSTIHVLLNGRYIGSETFAEKYENATCEVGFITDSIKNADGNLDSTSAKKWKVEITEDVPAFESVLDITVNQPEGATGCAVNKTPDKEKYDIGEEVELVFVAPEGFKLDGLTVAGIDRYTDVNNGRLTITADYFNLDIQATFAEEVSIELDLSVKALKLGTNGNLAQGTVVSFKNTDYTFTVDENGKIHSDSVTQGRYTVVVDGYFEKEIILDENLTEVQLEYDLFAIVRWDDAGHDLSHVNDATPYIEWKGPGASLNTVSKECMLGDATVSVIIKDSQSTNGADQQGLLLRFEDGKAAILNINTSDTPRLQFRPELFSESNDASIGLRTAFASEWVEFKNLTAAEVEKYNSETGIELKVVREGKLLYVFIDDVYHGTATLPDEYATSKMGFGFFGYDVVAGAKWYFEVSETIPDLSVTVTNATDTDANGTIAITPAAIKLGETVTITVTPDSGYLLDELTVSGGITPTATGSNTFTFVAVTTEYTVTATFVREQPIALDLTIKGTKLGTTAVLADGVNVTFKNTEYAFTVTDGKISHAAIPKATYTVVVDGYFEKEIVFDEDLTEVTLEYDLFEIVRWDGSGHGLSHVNEETPYIEWVGPGASLNAVSKECMFDDATVSVIIKDSQSTNGADQQGLLLRFEDGKAAILNINTSDTPRLQFRPELFSDNNDASVGLHTAFASEWVEFKNVTAAEVEKYNSDTGIELKAIREGNRIFVYIDDVYHGTAILADSYATKKMGFGLFAYDAVVGQKWYFEVSETTERASVTVTNGTAQDANGSISIAPAEIKVGDEVTVTITPATDYKLSKLTVGGVEVNASGDTYSFFATGNTSVVAEFEAIVYSSIESSVSMNKLGTTTALADETEVTLSNSDFTYKATVTDGKINLAKVAAGTYTVSTANAVNATVTVTEAKYAEAIVFGYDLLKNFPSDWNWGDRVDFSKQNDGEISQVSGATLWVASNDVYDNVSITVNVKTDISGRQGAMIKFGNDYVMVQLEKVNDSEYKISWNNEGNYGNWGTGVNNITGTWDELGARLDAEAAASGNTTVTLTRIGNVIYGSVNGVYCGKLTIDEKYATQKCQVGIYGTDVSAGAVRTFGIVENAVSPETEE